MRPAHKKERIDKEVRQLIKEQRKLSIEIYNMPLIKADKPLRHGWYKEIVLTKKIDRYKSKKYIEEIFEMLDTHYWGRTKKICDKHWDKQRSEHFIFRDVPTISKKQFNKLSRKAQQFCTPFQYRNKCKKLRIRFYIRIPKHAYRIKYTRAYITHFKTIDPNLESRVDLIENKLLRPRFYEANTRVYGHRTKWVVLEKLKSERKVKEELLQFKGASLRSVKKELWERS
jgi:hypothetical protein